MSTLSDHDGKIFLKDELEKMVSGPRVSFNFSINVTLIAI